MNVIVTSRQTELWANRWLGIRSGTDREFRRRWVVLAPAQLEIHFSDTFTMTSTLSSSHQHAHAQSSSSLLSSSRSPSPLPRQQYPELLLSAAAAASASSMCGAPPLFVLPLASLYLANASIRNCFNLVSNSRFFTLKCADAIEFEEVLAGLTDLNIEIPQAIRNPVPPTPSQTAAGPGFERPAAAHHSRSSKTRGNSTSSRIQQQEQQQQSVNRKASSRSPVMLFRGFSPANPNKNNNNNNNNNNNSDADSEADALKKQLEAARADASAVQQQFDLVAKQLRERDAELQQLYEGRASDLASAAARQAQESETMIGGTLRREFAAERAELEARLQQQEHRARDQLSSRNMELASLHRRRFAVSAERDRIRAQLAAVSAAHSALLRCDSPSKLKAVLPLLFRPARDAAVQCSDPKGCRRSLDADDDDEQPHQTRRRGSEEESTQVSALRDAVRRLRGSIDGTPLFESPDILPSSTSTANYAQFNTSGVGNNTPDFSGRGNSSLKNQQQMPINGSPDLPLNAASLSRSKSSHQHPPHGDSPATQSLPSSGASSLAADDSVTAVMGHATAGGTRGGGPAAAAATNRQHPHEQRTSAPVPASAAAATAAVVDHSVVDDLLTTATHLFRQYCVLKREEEEQHQQQQPDNQAHDPQQQHDLNQDSSSCVRTATGRVPIPPVAACFGSTSKKSRPLPSPQSPSPSSSSFLPSGHNQQQHHHHHRHAPPPPLSEKEHNAAHRGTDNKINMASQHSEIRSLAGAASPSASATAVRRLNNGMIVEHHHPHPSHHHLQPPALSLELAATLCALLELLKRRNREWLRHHLCAESIARFALALKRAGKILKSIKGCAPFADDFAASWKITEHLVELPRLLIEEDQAFVLLNQLLTTIPPKHNDTSTR